MDAARERVRHERNDVARMDKDGDLGGCRGGRQGQLHLLGRCQVRPHRRGTRGGRAHAHRRLRVEVRQRGGIAHTGPIVTATSDKDWLVTYWADRSNDTTAWLPLVGTTERLEGLPSDTGASHVTALLADSNGPVNAGAQGGLTATANGTAREEPLQHPAEELLTHAPKRASVRPRTRPPADG